MPLKALIFLYIIFIFGLTNVLADEESEFAKSRQWQVTMQYWKNIAGQTVSRIDDPSFFYSKFGKHDPEKELKAYLKALRNNSNLEDLICKRPARFRVVNEKFKLVEKGLVKVPSCERLEKWKAGLGKKAIALIFPAAYLNNPASMYGHTFLRFNSNSGSKDALLAYGASFGATTGQDGGVAFAAKGLLGGYLATFSLEPYYDLTRKYGDIEHRDIWEYELKLTEEEIERALDFIWEVGNSYVDYFFFDENCSMYVLATLEYARPSLYLLENFGLYVIPSDTLRVLNQESGLVGEVLFRASLTSRLENQAKFLNDEDIELAKGIAEGQSSVNSPKVTANLAEFSFDYLEYLSNKSKISVEDSRRLSIEILKKRSELEQISEKPQIQGERPDLSHPSGKLSVSTGLRDDSFFSEYRIRPSYHDNLDPSEGLIRGQSIQFFDLKFRHYEHDNFELTSFYPIAIQSFAPVGKVFSPVSWELNVGLDRQMIPSDDFKNEQGSYIGVLQGGVGKTVGGDNFNLSGLLDFRMSGSKAYTDDRFSLGAGPALRLSYSILKDFRALLSASAIKMEIGEEHWFNEVNLGMQYDIAESYAVRASYLYQRSFNSEFDEVMLGVVRYF